MISVTREYGLLLSSGKENLPFPVWIANLIEKRKRMLPLSSLLNRKRFPSLGSALFLLIRGVPVATRVDRMDSRSKGL